MITFRVFFLEDEHHPECNKKGGVTNGRKCRKAWSGPENAEPKRLGAKEKARRKKCNGEVLAP